MKRRAGLAVALMALAGGLAGAGPFEACAAEPSEAMNRVSFRVESSREVTNDWSRAVVVADDQDADPARLADRVNRTMAWALDEARGKAGLSVKSGGYHTFPIHEKGRPQRWRASQELILEGGDVAALSALLGVLQTRLELRSFQFSVSPELRRETESALIGEVLAAFKSRAELVRQGLDASGYKLVQLSIDTGAAGPVRPVFEAARMTTARAAPPALEAGTGRVVVRAQGTIQLE
ncbi:MAG: SIMPL domain-containing protein [Myxococcota bacterium]